MKLTPINAAEAIFEAFFDEQLSRMSRWKFTGAAEGLVVSQRWAWLQYDWALSPADATKPALRGERAYDLNCEDYDTLMFSLMAPEGARVALIAQTDVGERRAMSTPFAHLKRELTLPLDGAKRVTGFAFEIFLDRKQWPGAVVGWFNWIGLQHQAQLARHLRQFDRFDAQWEECLQPESFTPTFEPTYGLHLTGAELTEARAALVKAGGRKTSPFHELAADADKLVPEKMIYDFVNFWNDTRVCRDRDIGKHLLTHGANAAQAAVLFRDAKLGRLAARYAISLAHCTRWDAGFMVWMPGSTWEQRGFVSSLVMFDCALILDLCGEWFTDHGRELILRRLAEEGQGTNNFNVWWWEYLFWCNQTAWFMPGRMYAYLVLERTMPARYKPYPKPEKSRVAPYTELALGDLLDNLDKVLLPDGGYTEGPMYFAWTARQAFISIYYYARARGKNVRELMPRAMAATAHMAEMLVSTDDAAQMIMICDAIYLNQEAVACLAWLMPQSQWVTIFRKSLARTKQPLTLLAANLAREIPEQGPALPAFTEMPKIGQMASHRRLGDECVKLFLMGNQSGASHTHEDKGSFVLEFAGDTFAADWGSCDYSNPLSDLLKHAQRHNMLTPSLPGGERPRPANPIFADITPRGRGSETEFHAGMDLAPGWEGWFKKWTRAWDSPAPGKLTITDEWEVTRGEGVLFHWTTPLPIRLEGDRATIQGRRGRAILTWPKDVEATLEQLPLERPVWREVMKGRKELLLVINPLPEFQPRLTLRQRGSSGRLVVNVELQAATS